MSKVNQMKRDIDEDINSIKDVLNNKNIEEMLKVHKYMDSKYQSKINTWGLSQYGWSDDLGFTYELIGESGISENLENMNCIILKSFNLTVKKHSINFSLLFKSSNVSLSFICLYCCDILESSHCCIDFGMFIYFPAKYDAKH